MHQNYEAPANLLPVCNSSFVHKHSCFFFFCEYSRLIGARQVLRTALPIVPVAYNTSVTQLWTLFENIGIPAIVTDNIGDLAPDNKVRIIT